MRSLPRLAPAVTVEPAPDSTPCHDRGDRQCRAAADEAIDRDASKLALYAGIPHYTISRWRQHFEDRLSSLAEVRRVVVALDCIGRTFEEREAFLRPINEAAGGVLIPKESTPEAEKSVGALLAAAIQTAAALHAYFADAIGDGEISAEEYALIESFVNTNRTADALLLRKAQALSAKSLPMRGKTFSTQGKKGNR